MTASRKVLVGVAVAVMGAGVVSSVQAQTPTDLVGRMYWTDASRRTIQRANVDGSVVQVLVSTGQATPSALALDLVGAKMYWSEVDNSFKIRRANLDGSDVEDVLASVGPSALALDANGGKMYWTDVFVSGKIQRANVDGTNLEDLVTFGAQRGGIALDVATGKMYWADSMGVIQRANLDGSGIEDLVTEAYAAGIALDLSSGKMYWTDALAGKIRRANLDGSVVEDVIVLASQPCAIALDLTAGKIYWTDLGLGKIQRANLDGSAVQDVVAEFWMTPASIAIVYVPVQPIQIAVPDAINPLSRGTTPVVILTTDTFDAATVDPSTLLFGSARLPVRVQREDWDRDGDVDLVLHFETLDTGIWCGPASVLLTGRTFTGQEVQGLAAINAVGWPAWARPCPARF